MVRKQTIVTIVRSSRMNIESEVNNVDTRTKILSICSGYGGIELGLDTALVGEARTVCYVENEIGVASILASHMEDGTLDPAPVWSDLRTFNAKPWRGKVDILSGGFPCQPHSVAGRKKGKDDSRELSGEVYRIAEELGYPTLFLENVPGIMRFYYDNIRPSLQEMGYTVKEGLFAANETGAPHRRQRLFILAYMPGSGIGDIARKARRKLADSDKYGESRTKRTSRVGEYSQELAHANHTGDSTCGGRTYGHGTQENEGRDRQPQPEPTGQGSELADSKHDGLTASKVREGQSGTIHDRCEEGTDNTRQPTGVHPPRNAPEELADSECLRTQVPTEREYSTEQWAEHNCEEVFYPLYPPGPTDHEGWSYLLDIMPEAIPAFCNVLNGPAKGVARRLQAAGNGVVPLVAAYGFHYLTRDA
jgi:DNA (cytosine-5)-methyltransferase 1